MSVGFASSFSDSYTQSSAFSRRQTEAIKPLFNSPEVDRVLNDWEETVLKIQATFPSCYDPYDLARRGGPTDIPGPKACKPILDYTDRIRLCIVPEDFNDRGITHVTSKMVDCVCEYIEKEPVDDLDACVEEVCKIEDGPKSEYQKKNQQKAKEVNTLLRETGTMKCKEAVKAYAASEKEGNEEPNFLKAGGLTGTHEYSIRKNGGGLEGAGWTDNGSFPKLKALQAKYDIEDSTVYPPEAPSEPQEKPSNPIKPDSGAGAPTVTVRNLALLGGLALYFGLTM